jgi:hypothetical protein
MEEFKGIFKFDIIEATTTCKLLTQDGVERNDCSTWNFLEKVSFIHTFHFWGLLQITTIKAKNSTTEIDRWNWTLCSVLDLHCIP